MILNICPNPSIDCYVWMNKIEKGKVNRIEKIREFPGGKGVHVALAIAELGGRTELLGSWAGFTGKWIKSACRQKGIKISGIELAGNNRKCYTIRSSDVDLVNTEILEPGPVLNFEKWLDFKQSFISHLAKANIICLSGSWPISTPEDACYQLIRIAKQQDKRMVLDCSGIQLEKALQSSFFGLHLNEDEAFQFCKSRRFDVLLEKLQNKVELVAMTRGKEGLCLWYNHQIITAKVQIDKVISSVGSGDCLTAGIVWAVERGYCPEEIARYGVACGAANCLNEDLGMIRREDVERLLPIVNINIENEY